ncbi:MAG TPA: PVC-type heme-binding CxxCH protein [Pirellulales bacterium]|nr:PVC-type heme-binding CxxCH protein [Pirellulales bacterium]
MSIRCAPASSGRETRDGILRVSPWIYFCCLVGCLIHAGSPHASAQPTADADFGAELPRIPPVEPADTGGTFTVQPGYRLEMVAAEPLVNDPVAAAFDEDGRLYVVEMRGYSEQADELLSRVRLLTDTDGDGRFDKSMPFVEHLSWPTAIACYDGGVFIGDAPDILYCKDTDGDGRADVRRTVFTGFSKTNVQGLLNSFCWGLDNRIHGATSTGGGNVQRVDDQETDIRSKSEPKNLNGRDFAFDPRTLELSATSGGAQHGMSFDAWGRKFVCSNSDHLQQVMYEDRYIARNPYLTAPGPRRSIAADGPQAEVFRTSPVEPWRIVRTRLRVSGAAPGIIEGGGRAAGYFTGATGVTIYKGDAWPTSQEWAIVGDVGSNLVHRKRLEPDDKEPLEFVGRRVDENSEFVSSRDIWFRPAQFLNVPDGTLYILDVYREVIEHPASLPPMIKRHLDLTSGRDRGRIYRIAPDGWKGRPAPALRRATTPELVALLGHANSWHRDTAARLLFERRDAAAVPLLKRLLTESPEAFARLHALYALSGLGALAEKDLLHGLADEHPGVRRHAVTLSEPFLDGSAELGKKLLAMVADDDLSVRYQVAFSLGEMRGPERLPALIALARRDAGDPWMRLAIQSSLAAGAAQVLDRLADSAEFRQSDAGNILLASLARQIGLANQPADSDSTLSTIERLARSDAVTAAVLVRGLAAGLAQRGANLESALAGDRAAAARHLVEGLIASARTTAASDSEPVNRRVAAIDTLGLAPFADVEECLRGLVNERQPQDVQRAALRTLGRFDDAAVASIVLTAWPGLGPAVRSAASDLLFSRPIWIAALFDAVEQSEIGASDLDAARLKLLSSQGDAAIRSRAEKLFASLAIGRRQDVVEAYRDVLTLPGDAPRGKAAFKKVCAACHRVEGVGQETGPNLATVKSRGADAILVNLLDPSREVNPQFVNYVLVTDDGRSLTGMIGAETATSVTLRRAEGAGDTVLRVNIEELRSTGQSLMPDGLEKQLTKQEMADLIAYLLSVP